MKQLTDRQLNILDFIRKHKNAGNLEIKEYLERTIGSISRVTVVRDINELIHQGLIKQRGEGRSVSYLEKEEHPLLKYIDVENYFKQTLDKRDLLSERFNFDVINNFKNIFSERELKELNSFNDIYRKKISKLSPTILKKEFERLTIELSWKSSQIEGNTYSLIDTEILIKEHKEAKGHSKEEAIMILNHKKAFDYILDKSSDFKDITTRKIENIHNLIVDGLGVSTGIRKKQVGIIGTKYKPLDNEHQIKEATQKVSSAINSLPDPFSKTLAIISLISYIQPFEDGNKRTARLAGNAVLLAHNASPLSFRNIEESDYKKAIILFYEQNSARFLKELFISQFKFSVENYF